MIIDPNDLNISSFLTGEIKKYFTNLTKMYEIYIDKILLPLAPSKIEIKNKNMNKIYDLVNGSQFNFLKEDGLKSISFEAIIPAVKYPFALYKNNVFKNAKDFIDELKELKESMKPFMLKIIRGLPYDDNIKVSFEEFSIAETTEEGRDIIVRLTFKEYRDLNVKEVISVSSNSNNIANSLNRNNNGIQNSTLVDNNDNYAVINSKRPLSTGINLLKKSNKINAKNLVLTSRKHSGGVDKIEDIKKGSNITSNLEVLPKKSWW